ncbi:MAG: sialate O-acetylesterase [Myxococcales bacterium]|nr:sialate O-acetylesterase [Myxococcota bacterium]MDW8283393.1 sialate O-acetylesterase [Myxococcales bacterium]
MRLSLAWLCLLLAPAGCLPPPEVPAPPGPEVEPLDPRGGLRSLPWGGLVLDPTIPVQEEDSTTLWRSYQDVDVMLEAPAAGQLRIELWSDGSAEERAGNALPVTVGADGRIVFALRLGSKWVELGSTQIALGVSERRLRLRLRRQDRAAVLYIDHWRGGTWVQHPRTLGVDSIALCQGRRTLVLEPEGARIEVVPQPPAEAFSFNRAFDRMANWKLYQRRMDGRADLPLSFAYRAERPALLVVELLGPEGSLRGGPMRLPLPPSPGRSVRVLLRDVPQGGGYQLRGRLLDAAGGDLLGEDTVSHIAVGDVFLAIGQSNMSGFAPLEPREEPDAQVHLFGNDYRWRQAREPMDSGQDQVDRVSEEWPAHSLMLSFAKEVSRGAGVPVAIIPGPRYGTNIDHDWRRLDEQPLHRGTLYGSAVHRVLLHGYEAPIRGILWYQGEGNAGSGTDNYLRQLIRHVADLRRDLGGPVFLANCQLATNGMNRTEQDLTYYMQVQEAQRRYALHDPRSAVVALVDLPRSDPWHLNNAGIREAGRRLARAVLAGSYGLPQVLGPQLQAASLTPARDVIELLYDKPMRGGDAALLRARDDAGPLPIASVVVQGPRVQVWLRRPAQGTPLLSYGYSSNPGAGWLVAADGSGGALVFQDLPIR